MPIYVGSQAISDLKIGSTDVKEVWVGSQKVFPGTTDTGWLVPTYSFSGTTGGAGEVRNPESVWSTNLSSSLVAFAYSSSQTNAFSVGFLPPINATEILEWGIIIKGISGGQVFLTADFDTFDAADDTPPPGDISKSGLGGAVETFGPSSTDWDSGTGDSTDYLGSSPAVLAWWAGGAGFRATARDTSSSLGSQAYTYQVRVIYR